MFQVIKCPKCKKEYLPAEIFIPKYFIGSPEHIQRDEKNHIIDFVNNSMDTTEHFVCDNCETYFTVEAIVTFNTKFDPNDDFSKDYITKIK